MSFMSSRQWALRETVRGIASNVGLFSFSTLLSALALSIPLFIACVGYGLSEPLRTLPTSVEITVFTAADAKVETLEKSIASVERVIRTEIVSREEAFQALNESLGARQQKNAANPLPDIVIATLAQDVSAAQTAAAAKAIEGIKGVDFVACSFVSKAQDILDVRNFLHENGSDDIDLIAKIENRAGVNNLQSILDVSDGIMIGRGDMGVEIPYEELPDIQKTIINACRRAGKRCITATEMLESMISKPRPTRAEISDVANAVYDGSSAVMLSGETAAGLYPVQAVAAMARIAIQAESKEQFIQKVADKDFLIRSTADALSHSACTLAKDVKAKAIVVCTRTGGTAKMVSRFRPMIDIIGMTTNARSYQKLALSWGVMPVMSEEYNSVDVLFHFAKCAARDSGLVKKGDTIVITGGTPNGKSGNSNLINIETI